MFSQEGAHRLPHLFGKMCRNTSVSNKFEGLLRVKNIEQDAIILRGIPDSEFREEVDGTFSNRIVLEEIPPRECSLKHESNFAALFLLRLGNALLCGAKKLVRENGSHEKRGNGKIL